jgi:hypothetical protein
LRGLGRSNSFRPTYAPSLTREAGGKKHFNEISCGERTDHAPAIHHSGRHGPRRISGIELSRPDNDNHVPPVAQIRLQVLVQLKPAVISCYSHAKFKLPVC